jgi:hypothetical protein
MPENPSNTPPEMSPQADHRLSQIADAAAKGLGEDVRRELRSHLDDLYLGYRAPAASLSELDAMTLVEKHFGDPAKVRSMLLRARPVAEVAIDKTFLRRICGLAIAESVLGMLLVCARLPLEMLGDRNSLAIIFDLLLMLVGPIALWAVARMTGITVDSQRSMPRWLRQLRLPRVLMLVVAADLANIVVMWVPHVPHAGLWFQLLWGRHLSILAPVFFMCVAVAWAYSWIVCCEPAGVYRARPAALAVVAWAANTMVYTACQILIPNAPGFFRISSFRYYSHFVVSLLTGLLGFFVAESAIAVVAFTVFMLMGMIRSRWQPKLA